MTTTLSTRDLNRALMARQLLLDRQEMSALGAIEHLVGMQAQEPHEPYVGLWSRLQRFQPDELVELLQGRRVVRTLLMRRTLHLVTAGDALTWRPLHQPMLETRAMGTLRRSLPGVDLAQLAAAGRPFFEERPRTLPEVGRAVGERWPHVAPRDLGDALSSFVALVQVPPRGIWGETAPARNTTIEAWLGTSLADSPPPADDLVLRYLAAYGPAASAAVRSWSGLSGLPAVTARLRPRLRTFRDGRGRELLDTPDGLLPPSDVPVPPRFLPAFDNAVLGFDDRTRIIDDSNRGLSVAGARFLLVDGRVAGTWQVARNGDVAALRVTELSNLATRDRDAVVVEGRTTPSVPQWHSRPCRFRSILSAGSSGKRENSLAPQSPKRHPRCGRHQ